MITLEKHVEMPREAQAWVWANWQQKLIGDACLLVKKDGEITGLINFVPSTDLPENVEHRTYSKNSAEWMCKEAGQELYDLTFNMLGYESCYCLIPTYNKGAIKLLERMEAVGWWPSSIRSMITYHDGTPLHKWEVTADVWREWENPSEPEETEEV